MEVEGNFAMEIQTFMTDKQQELKRSETDRGKEKKISETISVQTSWDIQKTENPGDISSRHPKGCVRLVVNKLITLTTKKFIHTPEYEYTGKRKKQIDFFPNQ